MIKQCCGLPWLPGIYDLTFEETRKFLFLMLLVLSSFVDEKLQSSVCVSCLCFQEIESGQPKSLLLPLQDMRVSV